LRIEVPIFSFRTLLLPLLALLLAGNACASGGKFDFARDTLAFSNDTLWAYTIDAQGNLHMHAREKAPDYTRHCFVMCRATLQFYRFVRFAPDGPQLSDAEYSERIRHISEIPVWFPHKERVVIPGYADLRSFSRAKPRPFQQELGNWWPSYFRLGNWRMAMPFPRVWQRKLAREVITKIDKNKIQALFLTRFKPLNHCVIAYGYRRLPGGNIDFQVYDPNDAKAPKVLTFNDKSSSFFFGRSIYFNGGRVNAFAAYVAPWK
jgi:hypothetical protein